MLNRKKKGKRKATSAARYFLKWNEIFFFNFKCFDDTKKFLNFKISNFCFYVISMKSCEIPVYILSSSLMEISIGA